MLVIPVILEIIIVVNSNNSNNSHNSTNSNNSRTNGNIGNNSPEDLPDSFMKGLAYPCGQEDEAGTEVDGDFALFSDIGVSLRRVRSDKGPRRWSCRCVSRSSASSSVASSGHPGCHSGSLSLRLDVQRRSLG